jgi:hypothetical protein
MEDWKNTSVYLWLGFLAVTLSGCCAAEILFPAAKMPQMQLPWGKNASHFAIKGGLLPPRFPFFPHGDLSPSPDGSVPSPD